MADAGPGLYSSDLALDVREAMEDIARLPFDGARLLAILEQTFPDAAGQRDPEHSDFILAAADQFHAYGIANRRLFEAARDLISTGADTQSKKRTGMPARDLRKREQIVEGLLRKWSAGNQDPRARHIVAEPEPFVFEAGAFVIYPTSDTALRNPYMPEHVETGWVQNGWGGFLVTEPLRRFEYFAAYLIAILPPLGAARPDAATIRNAPARIPCRGAMVRTEPGIPAKAGMETVASGVVDGAAAERAFPPDCDARAMAPLDIVNALFLDLPSERDPVDARQLLHDPGQTK